MYLFASCANLLTKKHNSYNVSLTIHADRDTIFDMTNIIVSFENNSIEDIYLLNHQSVAISSWPRYEWDLEILFEGTEPMISCPLILVNFASYVKDDYLLLKCGEKFTFNFGVDFNKLIREADELKFRNDICRNDNFGEYSLKLIYKDPIGNFRKRFRGKVESNEIKLSYRKK
jgi:hypothetical protein